MNFAVRWYKIRAAISWIHLMKRKLQLHSFRLLQCILFTIIITLLITTLTNVWKFSSHIKILTLDSKSSIEDKMDGMWKIRGFDYVNDLNDLKLYDDDSQSVIKLLKNNPNSYGYGFWFLSYYNNRNLPKKQKNKNKPLAYIKLINFQYDDPLDVTLGLNFFLYDGKREFGTSQNKRSIIRITFHDESDTVYSADQNEIIIANSYLYEELYSNSSSKMLPANEQQLTPVPSVGTGFCNKIVTLPPRNIVKIQISADLPNPNSFLIIDKITVVVSADETSRSLMFTLASNDWCEFKKTTF